MIGSGGGLHEELTKVNPYLALSGELWRVFCFSILYKKDILLYCQHP